MVDFEMMFEHIHALLRDDLADVALALIHVDRDEIVSLLDGEISASDALSYASILFELGMDVVAREVVAAVLDVGLEPANDQPGPSTARWPEVSC